MFKPGARVTFRSDILRRLRRTRDCPVFTVLEVRLSSMDPARHTVCVLDADGFPSSISLDLLVKLDDLPGGARGA